MISRALTRLAIGGALVLLAPMLVGGCGSNVIVPLQSTTAGDGGVNDSVTLADGLFSVAQCYFTNANPPSPGTCITAPCSFTNVAAQALLACHGDDEPIPYFQIGSTLYGTNGDPTKNAAILKIDPQAFVTFEKCLSLAPGGSTTWEGLGGYTATGLVVGQALAVDITAQCGTTPVPALATLPAFSTDLCYFEQDPAGSGDCVVSPCSITNVATAPPTCIATGGYDNFTNGLGNIYGAYSTDHGADSGKIVRMYLGNYSNFGSQQCNSGEYITAEPPDDGYHATSLRVLGSTAAQVTSLCRNTIREADGSIPAF